MRFFLALWAVAAYAAPIVSYHIQARLDTHEHAIEGSETLTWHNDSPDTIGELRFHLYLNAFQNEKSTFMRESGGQLRTDAMPKDGWGYIEVRSMKLADGADLSKAIRFIHPDDNNDDDQTVAAVTLPKPVPPGGSITLEINFLSKLPKVFARTGYHNDFYMAGQWFPKIGVYEKAGDRYATVGAWNCHQFHATSEFYADYGDWDVSVTVPSNYVFGATGVQQSATENPSAHETTYRYTQQNVHDFAWTASPRFLRIESLWDPKREASSKATLPPVRMILLIQPEHRSQIDRHFRALANGLSAFGQSYGAYPYQTITVVDPPHGAAGSGGMEYPTLITAGTSFWPGAHESNPEEVVIHEFGHQYWYGMVGTNEFEESWLDEGFNTYSTTKVLDQVYGLHSVPFHWLGLPVQDLLGLPTYTGDALNRTAYLFYAKEDPVVRNAWEYYSQFSYGINSYMRPGILLRTMENYLGAAVMARIMRTWFERYQYRHPTSLDFARVVNEVSGKDMKWFFDQFVFGTNALDYKVDSVECDPEPVRQGIFIENGKRVTINAADAKKAEKNQPKTYKIVVKLKREGEAVFPVEMKMTLDDGSVIRREWDGRDRWVKYEFTGKSQAKRVEIDPDHKILLDVDFENNSWVRSTAPLPFSKWFSNLLFWCQMVMS